MRVLVTGHTGFKGSWLSLMLMAKGHEVFGVALDPDPESLFSKIDLGVLLKSDFRTDIRDFDAITQVVDKVKPDVVIHLAAQALVLDSYRSPFETFSINAQGTVNLIQAISTVAPEALLIAITTDKVYRNVGKPGGYVEGDELGASDPYSSSKVMADIALQSWATSFPAKPRLSIVRAGNVIGPMDHSKDRLIPDILRATKSGELLAIRNPLATRPWQHVLDCLYGYVLLMEKMVNSDLSGIWNFGPLPTHEKRVQDVLDVAKKYASFEFQAEKDENLIVKEHDLLTLDSSKAREQLDWSDKFTFEKAVGDSILVQREFEALGTLAAQEHAANYVTDYLNFVTLN